MYFFFFFFLVWRKKYFSMVSKKLEPFWSESSENDKKHTIIRKHHVEKSSNKTVFFFNFDDHIFFSANKKCWRNLIISTKTTCLETFKSGVFKKYMISIQKIKIIKVSTNLKNQKNISDMKFWQNLKIYSKVVSPEMFESGVCLQNINYL